MSGGLAEFLTQNEDGFRKARLPALYSDFRAQRTLNPDGYAANVSAWHHALASITRSGLAPSRSGGPPNILTLNTDDSLLGALESRQYGRPLALGAVIHEAVAKGDLIPLADFLRAKQSIYASSSSSWLSLPWNAVSWGLRQVGLTGTAGAPPERLPKAQFVVLANVEAAYKAFAERTAAATADAGGSQFERTWSKAHFLKTFAGTIFPTQTLSATDADVLLTFMSRDKGIAVYDGKVVKIKDASAAATAATAAAATTSSPAEATITAEDEAVAQLKELTEYLTHQTTILSRRIEELTATAREAVARKNRVTALAALKSKKLAESSLSKRFATLSQLEEVSARIEQAADQVALVKVMASSSDALRSLNEQVGGAGRVEDVVERLRVQMDAVDEVGSILAESTAAAGGLVVDEGEIDEEFEALEREERRKADEAERVRREAQEMQEAAEVRRRLEAVEGAKKPLLEKEEGEEERNLEKLQSEAVEGFRRLSLVEERPQLQPAS